MTRIESLVCIGFIVAVTVWGLEPPARYDGIAPENPVRHAIRISPEPKTIGGTTTSTFTVPGATSPYIRLIRGQ